MARIFVGRQAQRTQLASWLAERIAGRPGPPPATFVSGEAGVGKTALVQAALPDGARVVRAAAVPWQPTPYGLLQQVVPGSARLTGSTGDIRDALVDRGRPLVLVLDDLHWSDDATLDLLPAVIDAVAGDPVAVVGTYRSDELPRDHLVRRVRAQLRQRGQLTEVTLAPLDRHAQRDLIAAVLGRPPTEALATAVADRTEGLPFFIEELLAALGVADWLTVEGGRAGLAAGEDLPLPESVRDAVLLRAARLTEASREALRIAAVIGVAFDVGAVVALSPHGWPDEIDHCGLITVGAGDTRQFRHALTQESMYSDLSWSRRQALHLAVADLLADRGDAPATVARHLLAGHDAARARPALVAAAEHHLGAHAYRDAARLLETALSGWPSQVDDVDRLAVVDRLARCAELSGDHAAAVSGLRELADRPGPPLTGAEVRQRLAVQYELLGQWPLALATRELAADLFDRAGQPGDAATERLSVATHLRSAGSFRAALDALDAAETAARAADRPELLCRIGGLRGNVLARQGHPERGLPVVREALAAALDRDLAAPAAEIYQRLADSLEHAGDYRGAARAYDDAFEFCQTNAQTAAGQLCQACATVVLFHSGRWERAIAVTRAVQADPVSSAHARAVAAGVSGLVYAMRGQADAARSALLESRAVAGRIDLIAMELLSTWGMALLDESSGQPGRAADYYRHVVTRCRESEERHYCVPVLQFAAARFADDGALADLGAATAVLADAVAATGQPEARAAFAYALGESTLAGGDAAGARAHFRRAVELIQGLDLPVADTLIRHRTALALRADPADREEAAHLLGGAYRTARRLKARHQAERIRVDLAGLAGDVAAPRTGNLTAREAQVLELVGEGLTSREIGQRLFLSVRTVEMHVANAVARLGCRTRAEAARRFAALRPEASADSRRSPG